MKLRSDDFQECRRRGTAASGGKRTKVAAVSLCAKMGGLGCTASLRVGGRPKTVGSRRVGLRSVVDGQMCAGLSQGTILRVSDT